MSKNNTTTKGKEQSRVTYEVLEEFVRMKVQEFIQDILEREVAEFLGRKKTERIGSSIDKRRVYRNGYGKPRRLALMNGTVQVRRPRLRNTDEFESRVLPSVERQGFVRAQGCVSVGRRFVCKSRT